MHAVPPQTYAWVSGVLESLVASTLYSFLGQITRFGKAHFLSQGIEGKVRESISAAGLESAVGFGPLAAGAGEELRSFLLSPETRTVVRQIYSYKLTESKNGGIEPIRTEFLKLLQGRVPGAEEKLGRLLFKIILEACDQAVGVAIEKGSLAGLEAKQAFRHRILLDELGAISSNLELLSRKIDIPEILEFEKRYREQVATRHDSISPPHLDRQKKYPLDSLYVVPHLTRYLAGEPQWRLRSHDPSQAVQIEQLLSTMHRAVLLGNPGAGKSTFAIKVCHSLSTGGLLAGRQASPVLVVLRDYGAQKKERNCSILQFIDARSAAWYQVSPPEHSFEYLLLNGRAVVIFDGLDELLETSYRREIGDDIESFCNLYPATSVIVTSRVVGYEQAPLNSRKFETYRLADFDDAQVEEYARKWFSTDETSSPERQAKKAQAFLKESRSVPDLRSNPLMLALMCNIYLGEDFIPANRPEVYKKCALMLFERWDRSRRIQTAYGFESQLSPIMTHIAHWLYANPILQSGVTEAQLVQECAKYLHKRRYEHIEEAEKAAADFIEFCRGRAWVFSDTGTTPAGMNLYQFTHRTFLEYFTALYLFRTNPKPRELLAILRPRIAKREWDVVAQLAFHIASREVESAGDDLMSGLVDASRSDASRQASFLSFAGRCLEFVSCSPRVSREVADGVLIYYLERSLKVVRSGRLLVEQVGPGGEPESEDLVRSLLYAASESRNTVAETIERRLTESILGGDRIAAALAAEIALNMSPLILKRSGGAKGNDELVDYWKPVRGRILKTTGDSVRELARRHLPVARAAHATGFIHLKDLVEWHGPKAIFKRLPSLTIADAWAPVGHAFAYQLTAAPRSGRTWEILEGRVSELEEIGTALLQSSPPWSGRPDFADSLFTHVCGRRLAVGPAPAQPPRLPPDALFAGFALAASAIEAFERTKQTPVIMGHFSGPAAEWGLLESLQKTLLSRGTPQASAEIAEEITKAGFSVEQSEIVHRWVTRKVNFVRHHGKRMASPG